MPGQAGAMPGQAGAMPEQAGASPEQAEPFQRQAPLAACRDRPARRPDTVPTPGLALFRNKAPSMASCN
jgi:hypothetical protein